RGRRILDQEAAQLWPRSVRSRSPPRFRRQIASTLQDPGPADERYSQKNAKNTAASPRLSTVQKLCGACAMKYATAISPDRRNATGRVKRPIKIRNPPATSRTPAMPIKDPIGAVPPPGRIAAGNANSF